MSEAAKKVLIVVTSDPRANGKAAEAVRIAAGVGSWEKVAVIVCFCGEARRVIADEPDDLINGEVISSYLPLLQENPEAVRVLVENGMHDCGIAAITLPQLAELGRGMDNVMRF
ncbi:MAG TPA: hypothetical protein VGH19_00390 [Verrucomicrobiae bacterium]